MAMQAALPLAAVGRYDTSNLTMPAMAIDSQKSKPRIPVVGHVITDGNLDMQQESKNSPINLNKVARLLVDPHSAMLLDRHAHALKKVVKTHNKGFMMKDLVTVFKILNVCADRIADHPMYIEPMCGILHICGLPFLKEKASDGISYEQIAVESVSQLGYLMRVPNEEVRLQLCQTLHYLLTSGFLKKVYQDTQAIAPDYKQKIVALSDASETLVKSLALLETNPMVRRAVLDVLQTLSKDSAVNSEKMLSAGAAYSLCSSLMENDPSGQILFRSSEILWNLMENGDEQELGQQICNIPCISQLRDAFIQQLTQGFSHYDRQLRNDLLVLASLVASNAQSAPFIETGFAKQLVLFATFQEVKSHNALVRHLKLMQNHEDFELKKLLITILVVLSTDSAILPIYSDGKLLLALFSFVKSNEKETGPQEWTVAQFEELQLHAMAALSTLGPLMVEDYMTCQGSTRLLLLLEWCTGSGDFCGQGNSFHGKGGRSNKRAQMRFCLRLIRSMVSTGEDSVIQDLVDQGAIHQLTGILKMMIESKAEADEVSIEMQCDMLFILSCLCDGDMHRKELFGCNGVNVAVNYLKIKPALLSSGLGFHRLMLAAVDCLWCAVVGCYVTEDYLLEKEGVFLLIDMLEKCPKNMHNLVLGCLLDLCENPKTIPHVNAWRGTYDVTAAHLFCEMWRKDEQEMGVTRSTEGAISDSERPLMGQFQENQGVMTLPANCPSQAIVDVSENMRAKLYSLFCKIGFIELPGVNTEDHVTLTVIEHYLDFKVGEVWSEIVTELNEENVRPVTPDREALEAISRTVVERANHVCSVQKELLDAQNQQDLLEEQEFYAEIRENHRQKERALNKFNDYVARTSNYRLLQAAKERQDLSIDASRLQRNFKSIETMHKTDLPALTTTVFSGRHLTVQSTPMEVTGGPSQLDYDPSLLSLQDDSQEDLDMVI